MAGLGYDAAIMANTVDELKDRVGWLAYVEAGIRHLPGKPVECQHPHRRRAARSAAGPQRDGRQLRPDHRRHRNVPRRQVDDNVCDVLILAPVGGWAGSACWPACSAEEGRREEQVGASTSTARPRRSASDHEQEFQLDGDHLGKAKHLRVAVEHGALTLPDDEARTPRR